MAINKHFTGKLLLKLLKKWSSLYMWCVSINQYLWHLQNANDNRGYSYDHDSRLSIAPLPEAILMSMKSKQIIRNMSRTKNQTKYIIDYSTLKYSNRTLQLNVKMAPTIRSPLGHKERLKCLAVVNSVSGPFDYALVEWTSIVFGQKTKKKKKSVNRYK